MDTVKRINVQLPKNGVVLMHNCIMFVVDSLHVREQTSLGHGQTVLHLFADKTPLHADWTGSNNIWWASTAETLLGTLDTILMNNSY